jgi:beta-glucosidase-like glycosyl hydrolase
MGLKAGVDLFLVCKSQYLWAPLCKQLVSEAQNNKTLETRIIASAERVIALKQRFLTP